MASSEDFATASTDDESVDLVDVGMEVSPPEEAGRSAHSALLTSLPDNYNGAYIEEQWRSAETGSGKMTIVDDGLALAISRNFCYRGRAAQKHRPRNKNAVTGLLRMLNRSLARPPGMNEIVRINPKYNIVLEAAATKDQNGVVAEPNGEIPGPSGTQSAGSSNTHYVLQDGQRNDGTKRKSSELRKDPCNTKVYSLRFSTLKLELGYNIGEKWPDTPLVRVREAQNFVLSSFDYDSWKSEDVTLEKYLKDENCKVIVIAGVLLSSKPIRETVVKKICKQTRILYLPTRMKPPESKNDMYLSDGKGRDGLRLYTTLGSGLHPDEIVSGIPCAVKGFCVPGNAFVVLDVVWSTPPPCVWPVLKQKTYTDMVFISGLLFGRLNYEAAAHHFLLDYLLGLTGSPYEQEDQIRPKTKVFFVGNSYGIPPSKHSIYSDAELKEMVAAAKRVDTFLDQVADQLEIFLIPGDRDSTENLLPQSPFKPIMFPRLSKRSSVHSLHNPCRLKFELGEESLSGGTMDVVLSSGANIEEFKKYPGEESSLIIGENMLKWAHLNPAAPDFFQIEKSPPKDIFAIVDSLPHIYVIGNQPDLGVRKWNNSYIVSLTSFAKSQDIVTLQNWDGSYRLVPMFFDALRAGF